jgi:lantibiotic modifying enzyme
VYAGTAGIALFMSQLHAITGEPEVERAAFGAIAHSIRQFNRIPAKAPLSPVSFYSGDLGTAYVARRMGIQFDRADLLAVSASILDRVAESGARPHMLDVIGGNAGAIPVLLAIARESGGLRWCDLATLLGEELVRFDPSRSGVSGQGWEHPTGLELDEFTPSGLSHGASGLGLALLELYAATRRIEFRDAARRCFEYEDTLFEPREGNWADLRRPSGHARFDRCWCNGAPGIALARLRAAELDAERGDDHVGKARIAIATTIETIDESVKSPRSDATLCHGLSGLGEILLIGSELLGEPCLAERAAVLAGALVDRHASAGDWPCGTPSGGPNPSLMLGFAGIGYWLLRLHDPVNVRPTLLFLP